MILKEYSSLTILNLGNFFGYFSYDLQTKQYKYSTN